ncbi:uncharacterized protein LOC125661507 isoform X1 [Ostrea edulis]|uniref:uncharacterized protein LOC125661507 isoform X1 n=1 Tax=Ostrea edulis TaxID=37623 RepID=UPI0024AFAFB3|nr:uncharacterized protein LOC125661507 isoform X1 [Ostrea edulis]
MGPIRLKYILLMFIFSHHIDLTISATTNDKLLVAAGIVTAALMSSSYGYYSWTPSVIALLTAILLLTLIPTQSDAGSTCTASGYAIDLIYQHTDSDYQQLRLPNQDIVLTIGVPGRQGMLSLLRQLIPPLVYPGTLTEWSVPSYKGQGSLLQTPGSRILDSLSHTSPASKA